MNPSAAHVSFQAFCNCYLREVSDGRWHDAELFAERFDFSVAPEIQHVVELPLPHSHTALALCIHYRSLVGRHSIQEVYERPAGASTWRRLDALSAQLRLIDEIYSLHPKNPHRLELLSRVIESHQIMDRYMAHWLSGKSSPTNTLEASFIESEQSFITGHWLHPTPKSRQGMHAWQHLLYAPEFNGQFRLQFFAVRRDLVYQDSLMNLPAEDISLEIARHGLNDHTHLDKLIDSGFCLIPVHPLQAHWLPSQPHIQNLLSSGTLLPLGELGPLFTATSSVRTVYSAEVDWMIKLSIPVKITNSLRFNLKSELADSVWISQLLRKCKVEDEFLGFLIMEDPAYISLDLLGMEETGFETIFRRNSFHGPSLHHVVHSVAALTEDPIHRQGKSRLYSLVLLLAKENSLNHCEAAIRWFDAYWDIAIAPVFRIYDRHGIAFEAHQQNVVIAFNPSGKPEASYYRDLQGIALAASRYAALVDLVPELATLSKAFEPDEIVQNGLGYYLIHNHLYAIIHRMGADGLLSEPELLSRVQGKLSALWIEMTGLGAAFIDTLLRNDSLPCKANLLTRIEDRDELESECELAVYSFIPNPLAQKFPAYKIEPALALTI